MKTKLSPLEALEKLTNYKCSCMSEKMMCKEIIENALKDYEMEHTLRIRLESINYELVREKQENEKKLKAFEIIKEKNVNTYLLQISMSLKQYHILIEHSIFEKLTQEEYDLLKEVLL